MTARIPCHSRSFRPWSLALHRPWAEPGGIGPWPGWLTVVFQCCDTVGWVYLTHEIVPEIACYVSSGTLNRTILILQSCWPPSSGLISRVSRGLQCCVQRCAETARCHRSADGRRRYSWGSYSTTRCRCQRPPTNRSASCWNCELRDHQLTVELSVREPMPELFYYLKSRQFEAKQNAWPVKVDHIYTVGKKTELF